MRNLFDREQLTYQVYVKDFRIEIVILERKMAPSAPKKERQSVAPDSKMSKERAMKLKSALINYAKKTNDGIKGMVFLVDFHHFSFRNILFFLNFRLKITKKSFNCCRKSKSYGRKSACIP